MGKRTTSYFEYTQMNINYDELVEISRDPQYYEFNHIIVCEGIYSEGNQHLFRKIIRFLYENDFSSGLIDQRDIKYIYINMITRRYTELYSDNAVNKILMENNAQKVFWVAEYAIYEYMFKH